MPDVVLPDKRHQMMAGIRGRDTQPELTVRRGLHRAGYRYVLHRRDLPGRPDIVLPKYRLAVLVHGCFWHRHINCQLAATPATRADFWSRKFEANIERDRKSTAALVDRGWRVAIVWECGIRNDPQGMIEWLAGIVRGHHEGVVEWPAQGGGPAQTRSPAADNDVSGRRPRQRHGPR